MSCPSESRKGIVAVGEPAKVRLPPLSPSICPLWKLARCVYCGHRMTSILCDCWISDKHKADRAAFERISQKASLRLGGMARVSSPIAARHEEQYYLGRDIGSD